MEDPADNASKTGASKTDAYTTAKPSKFHFKSSSPRRKRRHDRADSDRESSHRSSKRHRSDNESSSRRHHHHHRSSRRKHADDTRSDRHPTATVDGEYYDPDHRHRESLFDDLDANATDVFRESLFDALADDEGAAYWEGVYGQPINIYPTAKPGPDGKLERMTEDEYADFVRTKMWEKSHQHIVAEREAREKARRERREHRRRCDEHGDAEEKEREHIRRQMEESLRRGEERKKTKEAAKSWDVYTAKWTRLAAADGNPSDLDSAHVPDLIPWPVLSGKARHVDKREIERFLRASPAWKDDPSALLKAERVRWHPDKMQRRFGQRIDADTIRDVTAVFQIIDQLWSTRR